MPRCWRARCAAAADWSAAPTRTWSAPSGAAPYCAPGGQEVERHDTPQQEEEGRTRQDVERQCPTGRGSEDKTGQEVERQRTTGRGSDDQTGQEVERQRTTGRGSDDKTGEHSRGNIQDADKK